MLFQTISNKLPVDTVQYPRSWRTLIISWQKTKLANTHVGCPVCNASGWFCSDKYMDITVISKA